MQYHPSPLVLNPPSLGDSVPNERLPQTPRPFTNYPHALHFSGLKAKSVIKIVNYNRETPLWRISWRTVLYILCVYFFSCFRSLSNCIHNPTFRHSSLVSSSGATVRKSICMGQYNRQFGTIASLVSEFKSKYLLPSCSL